MASTFKVGDRVKVDCIDACTSPVREGNVRVQLINDDYHQPYKTADDWWHEQDCLTLSDAKKPMVKLTNMMKRLLDSDLRTLVKAEYIDTEDMSLTSKGLEALHTLTFTDKKQALTLLAKEELDEKEKEAKKKE